MTPTPTGGASDSRYRGTRLDALDAVLKGRFVPGTASLARGGARLELQGLLDDERDGERE
ncbi:hypothetical protein [Halobacterium noricense]|uniref:hypothetical protein n=1 Tax=Halobacterium noricense TaxID=223182 RepID=UPI001E3F78D5|nr:hypothetical protein [Halobacterium noricense]UHH26429.1 hypothetical protein LT974_05700 [Halobacterium noricense]